MNAIVEMAKSRMRELVERLNGFSSEIEALRKELNDYQGYYHDAQNEYNQLETFLKEYTNDPR